MAPVLIDTNLLVLFIVGATDTSLINGHKRLTQFSTKDFYNLNEYVGQYPSIATTPHVLAETSNFLLDTKLSFREEVMAYFKVFVHGILERHIPSNKVVQSIAFSRLGVADSGLLSDEFTNCVLLTDDGKLHTEALRLKRHATHFNELREIQL